MIALKDDATEEDTSGTESFAIGCAFSLVGGSAGMMLGTGIGWATSGFLEGLGYGLIASVGAALVVFIVCMCINWTKD